ncbi:putative ABC transporter [Bacteroides fluxus YIT 12057]|uniref:Transport permease protein n=2 Tax=Bacteroides fluxus TaxID=626930 RepID=F3PY07_9BACE|nr:putative ABC transporter [Bacteroides fluxus YIT 12057]
MQISAQADASISVKQINIVMKQFIAFVRKEFFHIFRDRRTMLILLGMPIVQIILFGFAITTEVKNVRVAVLDPSNDVITRRIIDRMDASEYFSVTRRFYSPGDIDHFFRRGDIDMVLVFSERFSDNLYTGGASVQIVSDATDPNMATMQAGYAMNIISATGQEMLPPGMQASAIVPQLKLLYNPQMKSAYNFVPGVMGLILMLICAMMTSISIVREKETGTMEILLVSPVKPLFIILAKAVPYFVLSFVNLVTILLLSVYVLGVPVAGSLFWLVVVSLLFIFVSLALGLLISTVTHTQVAAMLVSGLMLMMPTMLLSGMIFPIESMPAILQAISAVLPARWYIQAVRKLMIEGVDISLVLAEISILAVMAVILIAVSFKKFKHRLE